MSVEKIGTFGIHEVIAKGQPLDESADEIISNILLKSNPIYISKVVDENGEPRVVYHATDNAFTIFDRA